MLEKYSSVCRKEDGTLFQACLESHLFQGISGHILIGIPSSGMNRVEKKRYIKSELSQFFKMRLKPKENWFYSKKEKLIYAMMKGHMYDALILIGNVYHVKHSN